MGGACPAAPKVTIALQHPTPNNRQSAIAKPLMMPEFLHSIPPFVGCRPGTARAVLEAVQKIIRDDHAGALALVVETAGSTYVKAGAMAFFGGGERQIGWLSGGCLEPEIRRRADAVASSGEFDVMAVDTLGDEDLFSGSAIGCRGRLRLLLIPVQQLRHADALIDAWCQGAGTLSIRMQSDGMFEWRIGARAHSWQLQRSAGEHEAVAAEGAVMLARPATLLMLGAGPEAPALLPQLRTLGWFTSVVEQRARWRDNLVLADIALNETTETAIARVRAGQFDAALVMHHHFELDRQALQALAATDIPFIGLLGPKRRREDLFKLLPATAISALQPRLRSPVGLDLGGLGADSIALSILAQLQAFLHGH